MPTIEEFRLAFGIAPVPMLLVSPEGDIVLANEGLNDLFGYAGDDLVGQKVEVLVPIEARADHPALRTAYCRLPTKRSMGAGRDLAGLTRKGEIVPLELGLEPVELDEGPMALVTVIDIRQRKQQEARMHLAMDAAASAMVMVDAGGTIVFANKAAQNLFGYPNDSLLGQPIGVLIPPEYRRAHAVYMYGFLSEDRGRSMRSAGRLTALHRDGSQIPVKIALTPVDAPEGRMVMSTITDLTEQIAAAEADARMTAELSALNIELSHFAYSASHDLKAPLSSINGLLHICVEDLAQGHLDEVKQNLCKAMDISRRSALKVEGVLKIARAGRLSLPVEPIDLQAMIREVWTDLTGAEPGGAILKLDLMHDGVFSTEVPTLEVILENLISNALLFRDPSKAEHRVTVSSRREGDQLHVSVADNGVGIPADHGDSIFNLFTKIDHRGGDGLGLTLVKKQIDRLGGDIRWSSVEGEGAEFAIVLPIMEQECVNDTGSDRR